MSLTAINTNTTTTAYASYENASPEGSVSHQATSTDSSLLHHTTKQNSKIKEDASYSGLYIIKAIYIEQPQHNLNTMPLYTCAQAYLKVLYRAACIERSEGCSYNYDSQMLVLHILWSAEATSRIVKPTPNCFVSSHYWPVNILMTLYHL